MKERHVIKKRKTFELRLTKFELLHLRDLFGVLLPPEATQTLSQALATAEGRPMVEMTLWKKIAGLCDVAEVPLGDDAPDFIVAPTSTPPISVFQVASDPDGEPEAEGDEE